MQAKTFEQLKTEASWYTLSTVIYLIIHSNRFFPFNQGIFSFYLLVKTLGHKGCSSSCVLLKWNLEAGKKEETLVLNSLSKSEVWKDIKQSTQCYCCKKVSSAAASAVAQSLPHPQWIIRKIQGEWVLLGEMDFLIVLPCDYHEHLWTQLFPFSK